MIIFLPVGSYTTPTHFTDHSDLLALAQCLSGTFRMIGSRAPSSKSGWKVDGVTRIVLWRAAALSLEMLSSKQDRRLRMAYLRVSSSLHLNSTPVRPFHSEGVIIGDVVVAVRGLVLKGAHHGSSQHASRCPSRFGS
jgi:hypothetical protein